MNCRLVRSLSSKLRTVCLQMMQNGLRIAARMIQEGALLDDVKPNVPTPAVPGSAQPNLNQLRQSAPGRRGQADAHGTPEPQTSREPRPQPSQEPFLWLSLLRYRSKTMPHSAGSTKAC